jgi:hypothetical protein
LVIGICVLMAPFLYPTSGRVPHHCFLCCVGCRSCSCVSPSTLQLWTPRPQSLQGLVRDQVPLARLVRWGRRAASSCPVRASTGDWGSRSLLRYGRTATRSPSMPTRLHGARLDSLRCVVCSACSPTYLPMEPGEAVSLPVRVLLCYSCVHGGPLCARGAFCALSDAAGHLFQVRG